MGDHPKLEESRYYRIPEPAAARRPFAPQAGIIYHAIPPPTGIDLPMTASTGKRAAACGIWPSPISAGTVAAGASPLSMPMIDGADTYWLAGRASEAGASR
jgi:hypothetical protein